MSNGVPRFIARMIARTRPAKQPASGHLDQWPEPQDEPVPPRNTQIPPDGQHDGRPHHMNPSKPG